MSLLQFLQAKEYSSSGRVHVAPNIPKKLLSNALAAYGLAVEPSEVLVLIDDTLFGSGKGGCLIGQNYLAIRETFSDAVAYAYSEVVALEIKGSKLFLNKRQAIAFNMPDKDDLHDCFSLVQEWLRSKPIDQAQPVANSAAANPELTPAQIDAVVQMAVSLASRLGLERVAALPDKPSPADLNDLLMDDALNARPGEKAVAKMQGILQELKQEQYDDPDTAMIWQLPISYLGAVLERAEKLFGGPDAEVESQIFFTLGFMYGFSFHEIPEVIRAEDSIIEIFLTGFFVIMEKYQERSAGEVVNIEGDVIPIMLGLAKMATRQTLNEMVRKILEAQKNTGKPGEFEVDDLKVLLREANGFAVKWVDGLTREIVAEERALQSKKGDLLN